MDKYSIAILICSFVFSLLALVFSLVCISVIAGWKNSTHKVYTRIIDPAMDTEDLMNEKLKDIEQDIESEFLH